MSVGDFFRREAVPSPVIPSYYYRQIYADRLVVYLSDMPFVRIQDMIKDELVHIDIFLLCSKGQGEKHNQREYVSQFLHTSTQALISDFSILTTPERTAILLSVPSLRILISP